MNGGFLLPHLNVLDSSFALILIFSSYCLFPPVGLIDRTFSIPPPKKKPGLIYNTYKEPNMFQRLLFVLWAGQRIRKVAK
jgi:hypothetical protein